VLKKIELRDLALFIPKHGDTADTTLHELPFHSQAWRSASLVRLAQSQIPFEAIFKKYDLEKPSSHP